MKWALFILFSTLSYSAFASCGLQGTVEDRIESCKSVEAPELNGFEVISVTSSGIYYYHSETDSILSPIFKKSSQRKCVKPYKKITALRKIFQKIPKLEKIPRDSFRCILRKSSRYILLENETLL
jgi:hypothetical protein